MFKFKKFDKHYKGWRVGSDMTVDENEKIYRFMDIWKFLSLIEAKELFFSRQSSFQDLHEGTINNNLKKFFEPMNKLLIEQVAVQLEAIKETNRISCWKIGDASRDAMWQIYSSKHGLAIQTTLNKLELAIESNEEIMVGKILYSNDALNPFKKIPPDYDEYFIPSFWKSTDFKHESELRLMIDGKASKNIQSVNLKNFDFIDYIHLSPYLMTWQTDILKRIICKYGLESKIKLPNLTANFEPFKKV